MRPHTLEGSPAEVAAGAASLGAQVDALARRAHRRFREATVAIVALTVLAAFLMDATDLFVLFAFADGIAIAVAWLIFTSRRMRVGTERETLALVEALVPRLAPDAAPSGPEGPAVAALTLLVDLSPFDADDKLSVQEPGRGAQAVAYREYRDPWLQLELQLATGGRLQVALEETIEQVMGDRIQRLSRARRRCAVALTPGAHGYRFDTRPLADLDRVTTRVDGDTVHVEATEVYPSEPEGHPTALGAADAGWVWDVLRLAAACVVWREPYRQSPSGPVC